MESQPLAVVVLAAGLGKRMVSQQPKVLHQLAGLPLAAHVLRTLAPLSPSRTVFVVGHGAEQVRAALGDSYGKTNDEGRRTKDEVDELSPVIGLSSFVGAATDSPIEYAHQPEQLGTGHAVLMAESYLREHRGPVLVMYGDTPLLRTETLSQMLARHHQLSANLTMLTCIAADPSGYGRVLRDQNGTLQGVVEERAATLVQRAISEVNSGVYVFDSAWLWPHLEMIELNPQGEYYLTDLVGLAIHEEQNRRPARPEIGRRGATSSVITFTQEGLDEAMGINSRAQLASAEKIVQTRLREEWMDSGVTMLLPETVYLGMDVKIGADTVIYPGVILEGHTEIGSGCVIGPNTHIVNSVVGENCRIIASTVENSTLERGVSMGPYSHLRAGTHLGEDVHLGNFAEVKASTLGRGVAMGHFSYIGDATIGEDTNIGAGTITANYDGEKKNHTTIGKGAFIGVDTMLRAPIVVGDGARTGAGSVVTKDVPPHTLVVGMPARVIKHLDTKERAKEETGEGEGGGTAE